jgi:mannose-6-phosphate isomerase-like protein (cupin superfamily)
MNKLAGKAPLRDDAPMATNPLDALNVAPDNHRVLFENDRVRILDTNVSPGAATPVHAHEWPAALYVLSWSDFVRRAEDGTVLADSRGRSPPELGSGFWIEPLPPHSVENVGSTDLRIIAVEVKG